MSQRDSGYYWVKRKQEIRESAQEARHIIDYDGELVDQKTIAELIAYILELTEPEEIGERIERKGKEVELRTGDWLNDTVNAFKKYLKTLPPDRLAQIIKEIEGGETVKPDSE